MLNVLHWLAMLRVSPLSSVDVMMLLATAAPHHRHVHAVNIIVRGGHQPSGSPLVAIRQIAPHCRHSFRGQGVHGPLSALAGSCSALGADFHTVAPHRCQPRGICRYKLVNDIRPRRLRVTVDCAHWSSASASTEFCAWRRWYPLPRLAASWRNRLEGAACCRCLALLRICHAVRLQ